MVNDVNEIFNYSLQHFIVVLKYFLYIEHTEDITSSLIFHRRFLPYDFLKVTNQGLRGFKTIGICVSSFSNVSVV